MIELRRDVTNACCPGRKCATRGLDLLGAWISRWSVQRNWILRMELLVDLLGSYSGCSSALPLRTAEVVDTERAVRAVA